MNRSSGTVTFLSRLIDTRTSGAGTRTVADGFAALALVTTVVGCSSDGGERLVREQAPAHHLAQRCVSIASASGRFVTSQPGAGYRLIGSEPGSAERFELKPSGLGTFLLYDRDRNFLGADETGAVRLPAADDRAEWAIFDLAGRGGDRFTLVTTSDDRRLVVRDDALALVPRAESVPVVEAGLVLEEHPPSECTAFPEASLDAEVSLDFYEPRSVADPVVGFADLHAHLAFPKALGAVALAGRTFDRFGIEHALEDCASLHGPNGALDLLGLEGGAGGGHATAGYPDFPAWPRRGTFTHMQAYYRWIERAYLGGLRVVVTHVTGNRTYCQLLGLLHPDRIEGDCSAASEVERQTRYVYAIQDYVDAQSGGPGKGWFRVVTSAAQAREVAASNKLAVVLGVEYGELFECREGHADCTAEYVDAELAKLHELGVRSVFSIHRFDNAFGGTKIDGGDGAAWMNLTSKVSTGEIDRLLDLLTPGKLLLKPLGGHFWEVTECPEGVRGNGGLRSIPAFFDETFPALPPPFGELMQSAFIDKLVPLPDYAAFQDPAAHGCNPRGLTDVGRHLINRLVDLGMLVEIDHLSYATLLDVLDVLESRHYSGVVSGHGWIEQRDDIRARVFALGGVMAPFNGPPSVTAPQLLRNAEDMAKYPFLVASGIGTDIMGVAGQPAPDPDVTITYPFTSYDGQVRFLPPRTGNRSFDYATGGIEHYGLLPEWIENLRQDDERDGTDSLEVLMRSAEAYLQMWERAEAGAR